MSRSGASVARLEYGKDVPLYNLNLLREIGALVEKLATVIEEVRNERRFR